MSGLISGIKPHSLAMELDILPGDELVGVNGMTVQDVIEFSYLTAVLLLWLLITDTIMF